MASILTGIVAVAVVISVYDGDTVKVEAHPWPGTTIETSVRINGVDTPEIRGKCQAEKDMALAARDALRELLDGRTVYLSNVHHGKFAGRVVADIWVGDESVGFLLIEGGYARPYDGTGPRGSWCG